MAIDFDKIWASTSPLTPYSFTEANYKSGWNFIGATPPSRQMWDFLQKNNDEKAQYLFNNTAKYYNWQASTAYTVGNAVKTPTLPPECVLICTTAGTSDATEPDYTGVNIGDTVQDGTCEWLVSSYLPTTGGTLTGEVNGVTPATSDNSTKLATTAWGVNALKQHTFLLDDSRTPTIPNSADLNDYTTAGTYRATSSATSSTLSNCPVSNSAFKLFVIEVGYGNYNYGMQIILSIGRAMYVRNKTANAWTVWGRLNYTDV